MIQTTLSLDMSVYARMCCIPPRFSLTVLDYCRPSVRGSVKVFGSDSTYSRAGVRRSTRRIVRVDLTSVEGIGSITPFTVESS